MVGLGNADNTTDLNKPISTATQTALDTLSVNIDAAYAQGTVANLTANSANSTATATQTTLANLTGSTGYTGNVKVSGDIIYNNGKSLTSQIATLNGYKTSGTLSATTTFQTIYTLNNTTGVSHRGFITASCSSSPFGFVMAFFEWAVGSTYPTITQLAWSGGTSPSYPMAALAPNASSRTQTVFLQISSSGNPVNIQVKTTASCTIHWYITFI